MPDFLTRKLGPLPAWGWAALAGGVFLVLRMRKASSASTPAGTSSNVTANVPQIPTESVTEPGGFSYTGPPGGLSALIPTGAMAATSGSSTGPTTASGGPITSAGSTGYAALSGAGLANQTYFQAPGNPNLYLPVTYNVASQGLATGQPLGIGPKF